jgi:gluconate kinase
MKREGVDGYMVMDALNQKNYELCLKCMHWKWKVMDTFHSSYTSSRFSWMNRSMNWFLSYGTQRHGHFVLSKYLYFIY